MKVIEDSAIASADREMTTLLVAVTHLRRGADGESH